MTNTFLSLFTTGKSVGHIELVGCISRITNLGPLCILNLEALILKFWILNNHSTPSLRAIFCWRSSTWMSSHWSTFPESTPTRVGCRDAEASILRRLEVAPKSSLFSGARFSSGPVQATLPQKDTEKPRNMRLSMRHYGRIYGSFALSPYPRQKIIVQTPYFKLAIWMVHGGAP